MWHSNCSVNNPYGILHIRFDLAKGIELDNASFTTKFHKLLSYARIVTKYKGSSSFHLVPLVCGDNMFGNVEEPRSYSGSILL